MKAPSLHALILLAFSSLVNTKEPSPCVTVPLCCPCVEQKHGGTFTILVLWGKPTEHLLNVDRAARKRSEAGTLSDFCLEKTADAVYNGKQMLTELFRPSCSASKMDGCVMGIRFTGELADANAG